MGFLPWSGNQVVAGTLTVGGLATFPGGISVTGGSLASSVAGQWGSLAGITANGGFDVNFAGVGLAVREGANCKQGTFVLSGAATTVVANTSVTASSRILMTTQTLGTVATASTLCVSARSVGTSFTVTPSQSTDTSTIAYEIFEPG